MTNVTEGKGEYEVANAAETRKAIESLSDADFAKLMVIARGFTGARIRGTVTEPEDLVQDAIAKTLDGRRRWNKSVSIMKHLDRVMESDAGHIAEKHAAHSAQPIPEGTAEPIAKIRDPAASMEALDELEHILRLFTGDETALEVLRLKGDGLSASEIQRELGMDKTQYETVTKRIRRRLAHT